MIGRGAEPPVAGEREGKENDLAKPTLMDATSAESEGGLIQVEALGSLDGDRTGGVSRCARSVLNRLTPALMTLPSVTS